MRDQQRVDNAYILTIADIASGRDLNELQRELNAHRNELGDEDHARGMEEAMIVVQRCGIEYSEKKMRQWIEDKMFSGEVRYVQKFPRVERLRMIHVRLLVDTPWLERGAEIPLDINFGDVMRAFAPLPLEHDMPGLPTHEIDEIRRRVRLQCEEREKWLNVISRELCNGLRRLVEMHDPKAGVLPKNVVR